MNRNNFENIKRFLQVFSREGEINLRIFSDRKGTSFKGKNISFNLKDFHSKIELLKSYNRAKRGIFFVVNSGGHSDKSINGINAQFFECDDLTIEEQLENIKKFPLEPSIIVQTRKSLHVYFLIEQGKVENFRRIQEKLVEVFKGDRNCINESRVMRIPGFYHCKEEPILVKCIKFNPKLRYTQERLETLLNEFIVNDDNIQKEKHINKNSNQENFRTSQYKEQRSIQYTNQHRESNLTKEVEDKKSEYLRTGYHDIAKNTEANKESNSVKSQKNNSEEIYSSQEDNTIQNNNLRENQEKKKFNNERREGIEIVCFKCDFLKHCNKNAKKLPEWQWYAMITNLGVFKNGRDKIHELSKSYKEYTREETEKKIEHFFNSGTAPMTCETLSNKGYKCKKLGKECMGKSPASLAFKPLKVEELREVIKSLEVSEVSNATNVDTALKFIENFMYNIGVPLGKSIIEEDLKNHLKIKNSKDLITFYREVIRKFKKERGENVKSKKENNPNNSGNLPWYEEQDKGLKFLPFVLAKYLSENRDVFYAGESFLIYENGVYNISGEKEAGRIIMDYMLPNYCTMATIRDCRDQWDILVSREFDDFNRNPYIVNTKNGLLDIRDESFKEHTPTYLSTVQLNVEYNPQADCPQFKKFLSEVVDCRLIPLVQEIVGYLLTTNTVAQKSFVFWGPARTGKSTLLWVVEYLLLGKKNVSNIPWQDIGDKFKTAELLGKLANVFSDLPSKSIDDTGIFKVLTGEDYLMAEKKNKNPFKFKPFSRLVFSCNELPRNYVDRTEGFYRRLIIVPFNRQIDKSKVDKHLKSKFQKEKEGILNWALEGLKRLYENNFEFSENEITEDIKKEYKRENNNVISFVEECCELDETFQCIRGELYDRYKEFCEKTGFKALSQIKFNRELESNFTVERTRAGFRLWNGIRIKFEDMLLT